jgi:hypothetical protein
MAIDPPGMTGDPQQLSWLPQPLLPAGHEEDPSEQDPSDQWFFQFHEHLLLTVQAVNRLREALAAKMP